MRKIIIAATTVATLAAPAVSMAANSHVATSRVNTPYNVSYADPSAGNTFTCNGMHEVKVGKTPQASFVIDKFHCKITSPTTGKPAAQLPGNATIDWATKGGWASDVTGALATSMIAHSNAKGTGFSAVATYPLGS